LISSRLITSIHRKKLSGIHIYKKTIDYDVSLGITKAHRSCGAGCGAEMATKLTELKAKALSPGDKAITDALTVGLRLEAGSERGRGKWTFRFVSPVHRVKNSRGEFVGQRRDQGLGSYPDVSIVDARAKAQLSRRLLAEGKDPIDEARRAKADQLSVDAMLTFKQAALRVYADQKESWRNSKHQQQWINTLETYIFPTLGDMKVSSLKPADFAKALRPIWLEKAETASRIKQRCHTVMKWCWAHELVAGNPVDVVDQILPSQPTKRERVTHQPAMEWRDVPKFFKEVFDVGPNNPTRALLKFVILTAARSGEARFMHWSEVDLEAKVWTIPATRMKAKALHRVPLSDQVVAILERQSALFGSDGLVFPAPRGGALSDMAMSVFLRGKNVASSEPGRTATAHGFRSSFRDWASENGYARDLAERALAHTIANQAEAAYHRTDLLEQRRSMMAAWASFCMHE